jgi:hypothetical protein
MFEHGLYSRRISQRTYLALRRQAARWLRRGRSVALHAHVIRPQIRFSTMPRTTGGTLPPRGVRQTARLHPRVALRSDGTRRAAYDGIFRNQQGGPS